MYTGEMIITIRSVNTSNTSPHRVIVCVCVCVCVMIYYTLKIYSASKFQVHNTVLITIIIVLYRRSPEFIHLQLKTCPL